MRRPFAAALLLFAPLAWACDGSSPPPGDELTESPLPCAGEPALSAAGPAHWVPTTVASFEIFHFEQLTDFRAKLRPVEVATLELDQIESSGGKAVTDLAHARGTRVICYTSSGYEDWRADANRYPEDAKGSSICRDEACESTWPGEAWGDIRLPSLLAFLGLRADRAVAVGCDGIEFDNMDQAFNRTGLNMTAEQNVAAARELARLAHERGLAALAKNTGELACALAPSFEGVFVEECQENDECAAYAPYRGKLVAMVEYAASCRQREWAACNEQDDYFDDDGR
jgi:hypothetical protein